MIFEIIAILYPNFPSYIQVPHFNEGLVGGGKTAQGFAHKTCFLFFSPSQCSCCSKCVQERKQNELSGFIFFYSYFPLRFYIFPDHVRFIAVQIGARCRVQAHPAKLGQVKQKVWRGNKSHCSAAGLNEKFKYRIWLFFCFRRKLLISINLLEQLDLNFWEK